ncbi:DUF3566 domain-containing protein [Boudabousia marimammalium]|uniref:DUF3566 domain-containing protein n=1 Tax=Boudabousia marimammalium TaxID=156892 RepID=A0A1Q5PSM3_9ACTO|nr:DUF3566 domain-containing protein [Boudabousia marimammalium]OKL50556.1 hypothetical protein BM477_00905 [Boudabousia marimammalium]
MSEPTKSAPRRYRMTVDHVDPMSVLRLSFLLSVAFGIATIVAVALMWGVLNGMHVFSGIENIIGQVDASGKMAAVAEYLQFSKVVSMAAIISVINVILMTVISTICALLYNVLVKLVGGISVHLIDE